MRVCYTIGDDPQAMLSSKTWTKFPAFAVLAASAFLAACTPGNNVNPRLGSQMPDKIVWAWERPEDLRFLDSQRFAVAFIAQTLYLDGDQVSVRQRRQPLDVSTGTYLIAVTRIETNKETAKRSTLSTEIALKTAGLIAATLELPKVRAVQVDFDAVVSERSFYRSVVTQLRTQLPPETPLTMTSLASWCTGDSWFNDFPVDEAVPMAFDMGADASKIKTYLRNGNDWIEPLCRGSYGISVDDPLGVELKTGRRVYYFKNSAWEELDLKVLL